jgi:hypothetical protein
MPFLQPMVTAFGLVFSFVRMRDSQMNGATLVLRRAFRATILVLFLMPCALAALEAAFGTSDKAYPPQLPGTVDDTSGAVIAEATVQAEP